VTESDADFINQNPSDADLLVQDQSTTEYLS